MSSFLNDLAHNFAIKNNLSTKMHEKLQNMLKQQMAGILSRINEEEYDEALDLSPSPRYMR